MPVSFCFCFCWRVVCRWEILKYSSVGGPLDILGRKIMCLEDCLLQYKPLNSRDPFGHAHSAPQSFWQLGELPCCPCPLGGCDFLWSPQEWSGAAAGEPPLGENFSSLQRFHWIHISRVWCYSGGLFCLNSNEDHESWLHYKQRLLKLLLIQFNDKQWHFRASESVEHFFFFSIFFSYVCDLWLLTSSYSPWPIPGYQQTSFLGGIFYYWISLSSHQMEGFYCFIWLGT